MRPAAISVVIPTLNAARTLGATLDSLVPAVIDGLIREVVISDGGSTDETLAIAEGEGARIVTGERGRGGQLRRGAAHARGAHLLFLHADTRLSDGWRDSAGVFIAAQKEKAGVFRLRFDEKGAAPRLVAAGAMLRTKWLRAPYGDQGLLLSRALYDEIGGYSELPLFEDVEFVDRLIGAKGRAALEILDADATTSAERYRRDGYFARVVRNAFCLSLFRAGVAPSKIEKFY